ncbi:MAG: BACON domain-containing protein [candidate division Zixibacteria bacterium]|nr:BACON domain-containing protein [candidate division Zixibacteria bacterium]
MFTRHCFLLMTFGVISSFLLFSCGGDDKPTDPSGDPILSVSVSQLSFSVSDTTHTILISNTGGKTLNWNITDNQTWLAVNLASGSTTTSPQTIAVAVSRTGLSAGDYSGNIFITSNGGDDTIDVSLAVQITFGASFFPIAEGDTWYYTNDSSETIIRTISGDTTVLGHECKRILHNSAMAEAWSISDTSFDIHILTGADMYVFNPPLIIPFNLPGNPHHYTSTVFANGSSLGDIEGDLSFTGYVTKTVPAGTFPGTAELFYEPSNDSSYSEYYAPGVGLLDNEDLIMDSAFIGGIWYRQ